MIADRKHASVVKFAAVLAMVLAGSASVGYADEMALQVAPTQPVSRLAYCYPIGSSGGFAFTGLNPAIEGRRGLDNFAAGQVVEIDPRTGPEADTRRFIAELHGLGARVSIYLVGGHCDLGDDCDRLPREVRRATTGSWNWDRSERRIIDITHPAVKRRLAEGIENGWRLGANYIRIDNLHHPAGSAHPRTAVQMKELADLAHDIEDRLRAEGAIEPARVTGIVAHNNLVVWEGLIRSGKLRRLPAFLTSERTAQLAPASGYEADQRMKAGRLSPGEVPEIAAGRRLALRFRLPYTVVEFRRTHELARPGQSYDLPQRYVDELRTLPGISEVVVMPSESQYVGRGEVFPGSGPRWLMAQPAPPQPKGAPGCPAGGR